MRPKHAPQSRNHFTPRPLWRAEAQTRTHLQRLEDTLNADKPVNRFPKPLTTGTTTAEAPEPDALPPHDDAAEGGALACVLTATNGEAGVMLDQLQPEYFYDLRHQTIFRALQCLRIDGKPLDVVALHQSLKDKENMAEAGGVDYVTALPDKTPSPASFPTYLETVQDRATRRNTLHDATELSRLALNTAIPAPVIADAARRMTEAHANATRSERLTIRKPDELLAMQFDESDRILGDRLLAKGQSLVIAGAGSIGKSRLLLQLAVAVISGRQFLGFETQGEALRWLILQAENSNRRLQCDLAALKTWAGDAWPQVNERLAIHTLESDCDGFLSLDNSETQRRIAAAIRDTEPDIVAFDSLYNFAAGDLNTDQDMAATLLTISRLSRAGNPERAIIPLHHALTGKTGAARATGYDRASFGRNSKVLHSWTRGQLNVAPGSPDSNDVLVLSCGKCSNGKEFAPFAVRLNPASMIYELAPDFDLAGWERAVTGKTAKRNVTPETVRELAEKNPTRPALVREIMAETGCGKSAAYDAVEKAEKSKVILFSKIHRTYAVRR